MRVKKSIKFCDIKTRQEKRKSEITKEDKANGRYRRIDSIQWSEEPVQGWVKALDFPVLFHRTLSNNYKN